MPIGLIGALPGLIQAGGSLFGGKKRRREQQAAQSQFDADSANVRNFEFKNQFANQENTAEDLTVNQQASNFQAAQTDASLSKGLDAITQTGGGGGSAQAIADAALGAKQGISNDLAGQENTNQQLRAQQAASNQDQEAQGAERVEGREFGQAKGNLGQSQDRLGAANAAQQQAKSALASGLGSALGGVTGLGGAAKGIAGKLGGLFKGGAKGGIPEVSGRNFTDPSDFSGFTGAPPPAPFQRRSPLKAVTLGDKKKIYGKAAKDKRHNVYATQSVHADKTKFGGGRYTPEEAAIADAELAQRRSVKADKRLYDRLQKQHGRDADRYFKRERGYAQGQNPAHQTSAPVTEEPLLSETPILRKKSGGYKKGPFARLKSQAKKMGYQLTKMK